MNAKERMLNAISKKPVDRIPATPYLYLLYPVKHAGYNFWQYAGLEEPKSPPLWKLRIRMHKILGSDAILKQGVAACFHAAEGSSTEVLSRDEESIVTRTKLHTNKGDLWSETNYPKFGDSGQHKVPLIKNIEEDFDKLMDLLDWDPESVDWSSSYASIDEMQSELDGGGIVTGGLGCGLGKFISCFHIEDGIYALHDRQDLAEAFMKKYWEINKKIARITCRANIDAVYGVGGSYVTLSIISPDLYKRYVVPELAEITRICHEEGKPVIHMINGRSDAVLEMAADTGIDAISPLERASCGGDVDIGEAKKRIGDRVCLFGNVDPISTLWKGSVGDIEREIKEIIDVAGQESGLVITTSDQVAIDTPEENLHAYVKAVHQYGQRTCPQ